jgi:hypothetical protein
MIVTNEKKALRRIFVENFVGGTAWGLGVLVGASLIIAIASLILAQVKTVPIIGRFIYSVQQEVENYNRK